MTGVRWKVGRSGRRWRTGIDREIEIGQTNTEIRKRSGGGIREFRGEGVGEGKVAPIVVG